MKTKQPLIVISIIFVFLLACQTLMTGGNGNDLPPQNQEVTPQTTNLLPFETLTMLPPSTPAPLTTNPTETSSEQPDCLNSVVLTAKDTPKGDYLEVCANGNMYEIGPLAKGAFAVGPNNKFFIYCANNGLVYAVRVGDTKLQPIGDVKDFSAIIRNDVPIFEIVFTGSDPYKVTIREIVYKQNKMFSIPDSISAP